MQYQELGETGVFVSRVCLGTMTFGSGEAIWEMMGALSQHDADVLVGTALDAGVNFFDTADVYAQGQAEIQLGRALGVRRQDSIIATKVFGRMGPGPNEAGLSRLHIMRGAEDSLKRLNTDYIDLYQAHGFDPITSPEQTLRAFDDLVQQGKVRYIGCSNFMAWQTMKALDISTRKNLEKYVSLQAYYSLAGREIEREIVPMLTDQNLGLLVWSPLAGGLLTGKFTRGGVTEEDARRVRLNFPPVDIEKVYRIVDVLRAIALRLEVTVAQVALAWLLHQAFVTSVIIGAKTVSQLKENLDAADVKLSPQELKELDDVSRLTPEYPAWMTGLQSERRPGQVRDISQYTKQT